jgi:TctA family transporter
VVAGYLTIQLELSEIGAPLLDLGSHPTEARSPWIPYLIRIALVVLAGLAFVTYRAACRSWASRLTAVLVLVVAGILGSYTLHPLPSGGETEPMIWLSFIHGATSPFTLALIGAVLMDVILARQKSASR